MTMNSDGVPGSEGPGSAAALYASIDVGTNTVKLNIADLSDGKATAVLDRSMPRG
jgi:hypothetical protein